ncbi:LysR family transcriptional regulator [Acetobacter nitrogenifigens]|nr:LysR family transcriptional regulator [Acetobacter nitrogenifigens]
MELSVFIAAVDKGSLAAAARALGMTPAMAGKYLAALEASLGVPLLHRTTRRQHLTDAGQDYYRRGRLILEALGDADRAALALQDEPRGVLRITAPTTFGAMHLGLPVAEYLQRYPGVTVEMNLQDHFVDLVGGGFDLAVRIGTLADSSLVARRFAASGMIACAAPAYLERVGEPRSPAELAGHARLAFSRASSAGDWTFTDTAGRAHKIESPSRLLADNMQMLQAAALAGAGVAYGPRFVFGEQLAAGTLVELLPGYATESLGIHAVYPSARLISVKVRRFVDMLVEWFGERPTWEAP